MEAVWLALIVAGGALLTTVINWLLIRSGKREEYARQDLVAARLQKRQDDQAKLLLQAQRDNIARTDEVARLAAETAAQTADKLGAIEQLADGSLTAAYRAELAAVEAQLVAMRQPTADTRAAIKMTEARLVVMRRALADREAAVAAAQAGSEAAMSERDVDE